jgi:hypothetical protein
MLIVCLVKVGVIVTVETASVNTVLVGVYVDTVDVIAKAVLVTMGAVTVLLAKTVPVVNVVKLIGAQFPVMYVAASAVVTAMVEFEMGSTLRCKRLRSL